LVGGRRRGYPLLIVLLEASHVPDGGCCRVEFLVRDVLRLPGEIGRRRLDLSARYGAEDKSDRNEQNGSGPYQISHHCTSFAYGRTQTACGKSGFQLIGQTGRAEKHVRKIGIHWTVRKESLRRPPGMTELCIWTTRFAFAPHGGEAPQSAIAHIAERKERAMKLNSAQL